MSGSITIHGEGCYVNKPAEIKETSTGKLYARFTALSSTDKKVDGKYEHGPTEFWNITAWGDHARWAEENLSGGKVSINFVGVFSVEEWTNRDGEKKTIRKVNVWDKGGSLSLHSKDAPAKEPSAHERSKTNGYQPEPAYQTPAEDEGDGDADIPF